MQPEDLLTRLRTFALRSKSPTVALSAIHRSLASERVSLAEIEAAAKELAVRGEFSVSAANNRIQSVTFSSLPLLALAEGYRQLGLDPTLPFPSPASLPVQIPEAQIETVDAAAGLALLLRVGSPGEAGTEAVAADGPPVAEESPPSQAVPASAGPAAFPPAARPAPVLKLIFPENVPALLVPRTLTGPELIATAIGRIGAFLQDPRIVSQADTRLRAALRGSEVVVRQTLEDITARPRKASAGILAPTELSVRFWGHLAKVVSAGISTGEDRDPPDPSLLQSVHIAAMASAHQKAVMERSRERAADRKGLEAQVRKAPFVYTTEMLFSLKDEKGAQLSAKHGRDFISAFVSEMTVSSEEGILPFLVPFGQYLVQRDFVVPVFLNTLGEASDALRAAYVKEWVALMRDDEVPGASRTDHAFARDVTRRVGELFPVLAAVADGAILTAASRNPALPDEWRTRLLRCFEREGALRPVVSLLGLSRAALVRDARTYLPFWQTAPIISSIVRFFRQLFRRSGQPMAAPAPSRSARTAAEPAAAGTSMEEARAVAEKLASERMRRAVQALLSHYVPEEESVEHALEELVERWNPLLEPGPKRDLVRDVNALAQDLIHPIRRSFIMRPPDLDRIMVLAEQLASSRSLAMIKSREPLLRYLSIIMLRTLLSPKG